MIESVIGSVEGFNWDAANIRKNWEKHQVSSAECEEVFFNEPYFVAEDVGHSRSEQRFFLLGITAAARRLFVVFMIRNNRIRVVSARDMNRREEEAYEKLKKNSGLQE